MRNLFITGWQRSGTTLLARSINAHPHIVVLNQPLFPFFKMCRNKFYKDIQSLDIDENLPISEDFFIGNTTNKTFSSHLTNLSFNKEEIAKLKCYIIEEQRNSSDMAPKIINFIEELVDGTYESVLFQLISIMIKAYPKKNAEILGLKEAYCEKFIEPLIKSFNFDFKCIQIIRDPRAVYASRNYGNYLKSTNGKYPILFVIRNWRESVEYLISNSKYKDKYMFIKYENLVCKPEDSLSKICDFLDVDFSADLLDFDKFIDGEGNQWFQNSSFESKSNGFNPDSLSRWEEVLSLQEIGLIEMLCKREMKYLDYKTTDNSFGLKDLSSFDENEEDYVPWLKKYNYTLNEEEIKREIFRLFLLENKSMINLENLKDRFFATEEAFKYL